MAMSVVLLLLVPLATASSGVPEPAPVSAKQLKGFQWCSKFHASKHPDPKRKAPGIAKPIPGKKTPWKVVVLGAAFGDFNVVVPKSMVVKRDKLPGGRAVVTISVEGNPHKDPLRVMALGWQPALQFRTFPGPVKKLPAQVVKELQDKAGGLYSPTLTPVVRKTATATEQCIHIKRIPGHMTLVKGGHRPMPAMYDVVHSFFLKHGGNVIGVTYRVGEADVVGWWPVMQRILAATTRVVGGP